MISATAFFFPRRTAAVICAPTERKSRPSMATPAPGMLLVWPAGSLPVLVSAAAAVGAHAGDTPGQPHTGVHRAGH